jgi:hypothetical protein
MPDPGTDNQTQAQTTETQIQTQTTGFTIDDSFISTLPDDLKAEPSIAAFKGKGVQDVLRSHVNAQRLVGADKIVVPTGKLDNDETWNSVYNKLGRPENPDGYKFDKPQLPEGVQIDEKTEKGFMVVAHQIGLNNKQASALFGMYAKGVAEQFTKGGEAEKAALEAAETALKTEWGNKYDANITLAGKVIDTYGGKAEEVQAFKEKFGSDPVAIRVLANIGNLIGEGNFIKGQGPAFLDTPADAHKKAMDIMTNKQNPLYEAYFTKNHIRHNEAVDEVQRLMIVAKGNEPVDKR